MRDPMTSLRAPRLGAVLLAAAAALAPRAASAQRFSSAVEGGLRLGYGDLSSADSQALRDNPFLSGSDVGGGGFSFDLYGLYRSTNIGVGVEYQRHFLGRSAGLFASELVPRLADAGGYFVAEGTRSLWSAGPFVRFYSSPDDPVQVYGQAGLGYGQYNLGADYLGSLTHSFFRVGAGTGISVRLPFPAAVGDLHLGAFFGVGLLVPLASSYQREDLGESSPQSNGRWCPLVAPTSAGTVACTDTGNSTSTESSPAFDFSGGLEIRFTLPLVRPPPPEYLRVGIDLTFRSNDRQPEIERSPDWQSLTEAGTIRHVALQAPDSCENTTASGERGRDQSEGELLHTFCGLEMAELERRLVRQGYTVTGWTAVSNHVQRYRVTPVEAARHFGAQVLFQVNSMERIRGRLDQDIEWRFRYFHADVYGEQREPFPLPDYERDALQALTLPQQEAILARSFLGVTLNITAMHVPTGRGIWYFHWERFRQIRREDGDALTFTRLPGRHWTLYTPPPRPRPVHVELLAEDRRDASRRSTAEAPDRAQYFTLLREMIDAYVQRFAFERRVVGEPLRGTAPMPTPPATERTEPPVVPTPPPAAPPAAVAPPPVPPPPVDTPVEVPAEDRPHQGRRGRHRSRSH